MSLDERLRSDLRSAVEPLSLDNDRALETVHAARSRGLVGKDVLRQATTVIVVISLFAAAGIFLSWRGMTDRYRSSATIKVAVRGSIAVPAEAPLLKFSNSRTLAMDASTRQVALVAAHLAPDDPHIGFRVASAGADLISLTVTAASAHDTAAVTRAWFSAFASAQNRDAVRRIAAYKDSLTRRVLALHDELETTDRELARLDPATFRGVFPNDNLGAISRPFGDQLPDRIPPQPPPGGTRELELANERVQVLGELADAGAGSASLSIITFPASYAKLITQAPATRVDRTPPATVPALVGWLAGLVFVTGGAVLTYRQRTRTLRQVAEYSR